MNVIYILDQMWYKICHAMYEKINISGITSNRVTYVFAPTGAQSSTNPGYAFPKCLRLIF